MSDKVDPVIQEFLERVRRNNTPEEKAKMYRMNWRWDESLEWFASQCEEIRRLLASSLTG